MVISRKFIIEQSEKYDIEQDKAFSVMDMLLTASISIEKQHIKKFTRFLVSGMDDLNTCFAKRQIEKSRKEIVKIEKIIERISMEETPEGWITDEMIEIARNYPVDSLVTFKKGRCEAFCHKSNSSSMSHNKKVNKVHCFVCSESFGPIDIRMKRDGYSFIDAVKSLQN